MPSSLPQSLADTPETTGAIESDISNGNVNSVFHVHFAQSAHGSLEQLVSPTRPFSGMFDDCSWLLPSVGKRHPGWLREVVFDFA